MRAGHFENNPDTVDCMLRSSRETIADLLCSGVRFSRDEKGISSIPGRADTVKNRIMYHEDCTGKEITSALFRRVKRLKNVHIRPYTVLLDILADEKNDVCTGAVLKDRATGKIFPVSADYVVLATAESGDCSAFPPITATLRATAWRFV